MNRALLRLQCKSRFYLQPAFRYKTFVWATVLLLLDVLLFAATVIRRWDSLPAVSIFLMGLGIVGVSSLWYVALRIQRQVYRLFETHLMDAPEESSLVDTMLSVASHMTEWGLFAACISVGACIEALGEVVRFH